MSVEFVENREVNPQGFIQVSRDLIQGYDFRGRPQAVRLETKYFNSLDDVAKYIEEDSLSAHSIEMPILGEGIELEAHLEGDREDERVVVTSGERRGVSPRSIDGHHGVSTDRRTFFQIIVKVGEPDDERLDRGLAWIEVPSGRLSFSLNAGINGEDTISEELLRVNSRAAQVVSDLLEGTAPNEAH